MKEGFYVVEMFNEIAILEIDKSMGTISVEIGYQEEDSSFKDYLHLFADKLSFWVNLIKDEKVCSFLGKL